MSTQQNGHDCGVWTLYALYLRTLKTATKQERTRIFRTWVYGLLFRHCASGLFSVCSSTPPIPCHTPSPTGKPINTSHVYSEILCTDHVHGELLCVTYVHFLLLCETHVHTNLHCVAYVQHRLLCATHVLRKMFCATHVCGKLLCTVHDHS